VLIDGGYLDKVLDKYGRLRVDYKKLSDKMSEGQEIIRTYYYHCMPYQSNPPTEEESRRYASMRSFTYQLSRLSRFQVRLGKLQMTWDKEGNSKLTQKRVDVMQAVDLVRMSWDKQIDNAYLLSGDSDLVPAIEAAKDAGVVVKLFYVEDAYNDELLITVDDSKILSREYFTDCLR
jgi:uncharacterized LabA/DUF88 family protein